MFIDHRDVPKHDMGGGVVRQDLAVGEKLNVLHWNIADGGEVTLHRHAQEQFGYVIKGGFRMLIGEEERILKSGDAYVIPPDVPHSFVAIGETEAIDVFSPIKEDFPWSK